MRIRKESSLTNLFACAIMLLMLFACAQTKYYSEEDLGIRHETLYDENSSFPVYGVPAGNGPGESQRFARSFENSPPLIPHDITGMLPIARTDNMCMGCHMPEEASGSGATPIPGSHFVDLDTGKELGKNLDGKRYNCMQCHVIQTTVTPSVMNLFKGEFRHDEDKHRSNLLEILNEGVTME